MQNKYRRRDFPGCRNVIFQSEIYSLEYHDLYYTILKYACVRNEKGEVCPYFYENFRLNKDTANLLDGIPSYTESVKQTCSDKLCTEYTKDLLKVAIDTYAEIVKSLMNENTKGFTELAGRYKRDRQLYINTLNSIENNNCTLTEKDFEYYDTSNAITTKKLSTYLVSFVGLLLLLYLH